MGHLIPGCPACDELRRKEVKMKGKKKPKDKKKGGKY